MAYFVNDLRRIVEKEIARNQAISDDCCNVVITLESILSREDLGANNSLPDDLGKSFKALRCSLVRLNKALLDEPSTSGRNRKTAQLKNRAQSNTSKCTQLTSVNAELVRSKTRLTEREDQISALIEDGLRLSFTKELLEAEIAALHKAAGVKPPTILSAEQLCAERRIVMKANSAAAAG